MEHIPSPLDRYAPKPPPLPLPEHPIIDEVMAGKRFVAYPFVVSLLVISFNRSLGGVRVVDGEHWPITPLFGAALITILFGWWGFPWGIVWSPIALFHLLRGGRDATMDVLSNTVGREDARRVIAAAPKPRPPAAIWLVRLLILVPLLMFGLLLARIASA